MKIKSIACLLSTFLILNLSFAIQSNAQESCEDLNLIYDDALNYFTKYRGEEKVKKTFLGTVNYIDYKISLWNAQKVELTEVVQLSANELEYTYVETTVLAVAEQEYNRILDQFKACGLNGYIKLDETSKNYLAKTHYIDERDKDAFLFYDWPEFIITISNLSGTYTVKMRVLSKKMN